MKLSKEQKEPAIKKLSSPWGSVRLVCDGYEVTLAVERTSNLSYRVITYVNGSFKGLWTMAEKECPESRFLRKIVRPVCSLKHKQEIEKIMGKKHVKSDPYFSATFTHYMPDWASGKAAINHLCKVSESIQIAEPSHE